MDSADLSTKLQDQLQTSGALDPSSFSPTSIMVWMVVGCIGMGYFIYGKKQHRYVPLFAGIGLSFYPLFVSNFLAQVVIGVALIAAPFIIRE
ncbi:MAG: hypothetical protein QM796_05710 [Chthoniobacteraceae bacterium]